MAGEENKKFDAVVGGFLANNLRVGALCPEPELLAAYHERSLLPGEMNSWKEHIVGCARCQAILAELEATDSIPLPAPQTEKAKAEVRVMRAAKPPAVEDRIASPANLPEKRASRISRGLRWQWLAPAGALAAGLLVWAAWHENQRPLTGPSEIKLAKAEPPATPAPPASRQAAESTSSDQIARLSNDHGTIGGIASAKTAPASGNLKQLEKLDSRARTAPAKPSTDEGRGARRDAGRESSIAADRVQNQPSLDKKAVVAGAMAETVEIQTQATNAPAQNQLKELNAQKIPGPSPLGQAGQTGKAKSESPANVAGGIAATPPPATPVPAPPGHAFSKIATMELAAVSSPHWIAAPGTKTIWRVGHAGRIEFSSDGGASWSRQASNVVVDLTSGSAPTDKVCWIVGHAGTILLTTDAGAHWSTIHSPLDEDLGGVRAVDSLHATVWNSANTMTFETADGGLAWKPVASQ